MIFSGVRGYLKSIPITEISKFEEGLLSFVNGKAIIAPFIEVLRDDLKGQEQIVDHVLNHFIQNEFNA